jgi:hypothetical protein
MRTPFRAPATLTSKKKKKKKKKRKKAYWPAAVTLELGGSGAKHGSQGLTGQPT